MNCEELFGYSQMETATTVSTPAMGCSTRRSRNCFVVKLTKHFLRDKFSNIFDADRKLIYLVSYVKTVACVKY